MTYYRWPDPSSARALVKTLSKCSPREASQFGQGQWIATMLHLLGMSNDEFAELTGVNQSSVVRLRKAERDGRISLRKLEKTADALGADLVYALIPRNDFVDRCQGRYMGMDQQRRWHKRLKERQQRGRLRNDSK